MSTSIPLQLSKTTPDFESILLQLQLFLQTKGTWVDLQTSSTGETLLELMAAGITFNQQGLELAFRESFLTTAIRDSSIYAITRMLGVRISRKYPASVSVEFTRTGTLEPLLIPKYTQFDINGTLFFNRYPIQFANNEALLPEVVLHQGQLKTQTFYADSTSFREIELNELSFVVSDEDVEVSLLNPATNVSTLFQATRQGIWIAGPYDAVYYDSTTGKGDAVLAFGDGTHGQLPPVGYDIKVRYAVTLGSQGNNGNAGLSVSCADYGTLKGKTISVISGGANEKPSSYYKKLAPIMYKARQRAVTASDYQAIAGSYSSVASVVVKAQRDIAPNDLRWMNVVRLCILPYDSDVLPATRWAEFLEWFQETSHAAVHVEPYDPTKIVTNINLIVALKASATANTISPIIKSNIQALFTKELNTLGKRIAISDIIEAAIVEGVDYVNPVTPTADLVTPDAYSWYDLGTTTLTFKYSERA